MDNNKKSSSGNSRPSSRPASLAGLTATSTDSIARRKSSASAGAAVPQRKNSAAKPEGMIGANTSGKRASTASHENSKSRNQLDTNGDAAARKLADLERQLAKTEAKLKKVEAELRPLNDREAARRKKQLGELQSKLESSLEEARKPLDRAVQKRKEAEGRLKELNQHRFTHKSERKTATLQLKVCRDAAAAAEAEWTRNETKLRDEHSWAKYRMCWTPLEPLHNELHTKEFVLERERLDIYDAMKKTRRAMDTAMEELKRKSRTPAEVAARKMLDIAIINEKNCQSNLDRMDDAFWQPYRWVGPRDRNDCRVTPYMLERAREDLEGCRKTVREAREAVAQFEQGPVAAPNDL